MPINVTKFVVEHETKPDQKLKKAPKAEKIQDDEEYIYLDKDKTMMIRKSQYTMDMIGK